MRWIILLILPLQLLAAEVDLEALRRGAEAGDGWAQLNLGAAYDHGMGAARDTTEALHWYRIAAEQGVLEAQFSLAHLLVLEGGDLVEAARWMGRAAQRGYADAQYLYGVMLAEGMGLEKDPAAARRWWRRAAAQGHIDARERVNPPASLE